MATKKFRCKVCGYVHEGDKAPEKCPVCQAPASEFEEITEGGAPAKKGVDRNSNAYTIIYSAVMVILVAVGLAATSQALRPLQKQNEDNDKRQQILRSKYNELITDAFLINENGEKVGDATEAFVGEKEGFPVFVATIDGQTKYIMALNGTGLWGPLWGYLSVNDDKNTVYGADFSHQGETPGLGAEIATPSFSHRFQGKHIFMDGALKSIAIVKPGKTAEGQDYVDGISGGTITSQGVNNMIHDSLMRYEKFLTSNQ